MVSCPYDESRGVPYSDKRSPRLICSARYGWLNHTSFTPPVPSSIAASNSRTRLTGDTRAFAEITFPRSRTGVSMWCPRSEMRVGWRRSS
jgi:hypothetical protein